MRVTQAELDEVDDGITDEDLIELERIRTTPEISYQSLFFLFEIANPYGCNDYDGCQFND